MKVFDPMTNGRITGGLFFPKIQKFQKIVFYSGVPFALQIVLQLCFMKVFDPMTTGCLQTVCFFQKSKHFKNLKKSFFLL
ncbi:hypothetical protein, partial [Enterobacter cloacae complex sp. 4DZ3-17B2]|uniref:hypothetical protein n=1 Tax=Enterobacter cloacae complex sp. 4DZ3-17B2 TaxID=2511990 RepID=UPI001CA5E05E